MSSFAVTTISKSIAQPVSSCGFFIDTRDPDLVTIFKLVSGALDLSSKIIASTLPQSIADFSNQPLIINIFTSTGLCPVSL